MKAISEKEHIAQHVELASKCLAEHKILYRGPDKVTVGKPNGSEYRCDLIRSGSYLILVGDLDTMVWAYCPARTIEGAINWMARSDVGYYVKQKANIGMGNVGCEAFDEDVALWEAQDYLRDAVESGGRHAANWLKVVDNLQDENMSWGQQEFQEMLYRVLDDCDYCNVGVVPSPRLLWAWSIVRKANELLQGGV